MITTPNGALSRLSNNLCGSWARPGPNGEKGSRRKKDRSPVLLYLHFIRIPPGSMKFTRDFKGHSGCVGDRLYRPSALETCQNSSRKYAGSMPKCS